MTLREIFVEVDRVRPNAYTDAEKIRWLNTVEGRVYTDIFKKAEGFEGTFIPFEEGQEERELAVPVPFTDIYTYYLMAMIDFHNGDNGDSDRG